MRTQQINETFRDDSSNQLCVSDAREDKSPSITQEEEERLLASSPEISIHVEGVVESNSTPSHQQGKKHLRQRTRVPGQRNSQPVMLGLTKVRRVVLHSRRCTLEPIAEKSAVEGPHLLVSGG